MDELNFVTWHFILLVYSAIIQTGIFVLLLDHDALYRNVKRLYSFWLSPIIWFIINNWYFTVAPPFVAFCMYKIVSSIISRYRRPYDHSKCVKTSNYVAFCHYDPYPSKVERICPICIEDFPRKILLANKIICTECRHLFHQECINGWLRNRQICPVCRTTIKSCD
jgi:hypothetical protein